MNIHKIEGLCAIHALMLYEFNVHKDTIINEIYGDNHAESYLQEKLSLLNKRGILWVYGQLDGEHRKYLIDAIYKHYGDEAKRAVQNFTGKEIQEIIDEQEPPF